MDRTPTPRRVAARGRVAWLGLAALAALALAPSPGQARDVADATVPQTVAATVTGFAERADARRAALVGGLNDRLDEVLTGPVGRLGQALGLRVSAAVSAPMPFTAVAFELPQDAAGVWFRTRGPDGWSPWTHLEALDAADGPDLDTAEAAGAVEGTVSELAWVGEATHLEVATFADDAMDEVVAHLSDTLGLVGDVVDEVTGLLADPLPGDPAEAVDPGPARPDVVSRAGWGADEGWRRGSPRHAAVGQGIVHHTATPNGYGRDEVPGIVRAIYHHHTQILGWADIGYNLLVDRFGRVYEGRAGGLESGVVGAHARGHNAGTFGVSLIGDHEAVPPSDAAVSALTDVVAWQFDVHGIDADGRHGGRSTLVGHRDVGATACPGRHLHPRLDEIRAEAG